MSNQDFRMVCSNVKDICDVSDGTILCLKFDNTLWGWGSNDHHYLVRNQSKVDIMAKVDDIIKPTLITNGISQICSGSSRFVGIENELLEVTPDGIFSPMNVILKNVREVNNSVMTTLENKSYYIYFTYAKDFLSEQISLEDLNCEVKKALSLYSSLPQFLNIVFIDESNDLWIYYSDIKEKKLVEKNIVNIFPSDFESFSYITADLKQYKCTVDKDHQKVKKSLKRKDVKYLDSKFGEDKWISADNTLFVGKRFAITSVYHDMMFFKQYRLFAGAKDFMVGGGCIYVLDLDDNLWFLKDGLNRYFRDYNESNSLVPSKESNEMIGTVIFRNVKKMYNFGYGIFIVDNNNNLYSKFWNDHPARGY